MTGAFHSAFKERSTCPHRLKFIVSAATDKFFLCRPFSGTQKRALIIYNDNRISISQVYPFIYYWRELEECYDTVFRCISLQDFLSDHYSHLVNADYIILQTWFNADNIFIDNLFKKIRNRHPDAYVAYFDSFAPSDLRLAKHLQDHIDLYIKKHLISDLTAYTRPTYGDTNLSEYYCKLYSIAQPIVDWDVPDGFAEKVKIGPGFFTSPSILTEFLQPFQYSTDRPIDIHSRIETQGSPFYAAMRIHVAKLIEDFSGLHIKTGMGVPLKQYLNELHHSKLCFSPFGYGEVCWRDVEAMMTGSVLIKPDMSHLTTEPNIFIPNETYVPIAWDFSDLHEKVHIILNDENARKNIAEKAYNKIRTYLTQSQFVPQMKAVFDSSP